MYLNNSAADVFVHCETSVQNESVMVQFRGHLGWAVMIRYVVKHYLGVPIRLSGDEINI